MTAFQFVILPTDWLVYLLVAVVITMAFYVRAREHLRAPWRRVARSPSGMVGLTVLLLFVMAGLLDSVHYRMRLADADGGRPVYATEVLSVLDFALAPLRARREKTYSAPLATALYAKETVELPDGRQVRDFPRLKYGGASLADPEREWRGDVFRRGLGGAAGGMILWGAILLAVACVVARGNAITVVSAMGRIARGETPLPWRAIMATLLMFFALSGAMAALAGAYHVLGTDKVGQDVLYQSLKSIRTGLVIGTLTTLVMLPFAIALGIAAGFFGGWIDDAIQYVYTTLNSIPGVLLIAASVLMMQVSIDRHPEWFQTAAERADIRLLVLCLILGITSWTGLCRLLRGESLKLKELEYIQAARAFGVRSHRIITRHILPNVMHLVLISVVMEFSGLVLAEAVLSYVGVGVDPSTNSFGTMINNARLEMARDPMVWWSLVSAFMFMVTLVLAANLFADAVRDAFDPRVSTRALSSLRSARLLRGARLSKTGNV
jgi:peptide/nickel transport system permease protein